MKTSSGSRNTHPVTLRRVWLRLLFRSTLKTPPPAPRGASEAGGFMVARQVTLSHLNHNNAAVTTLRSAEKPKASMRSSKQVQRKGEKTKNVRIFWACSKNDDGIARSGEEFGREMQNRTERVGAWRVCLVAMMVICIRERKSKKTEDECVDERSRSSNRFSAIWMYRAQGCLWEWSGVNRESWCDLLFLRCFEGCLLWHEAMSLKLGHLCHNMM